MVGAGELVTYNTRKDASAITIAFACFIMISSTMR
jgi:hypothetical protein